MSPKVCYKSFDVFLTKGHKYLEKFELSCNINSYIAKYVYLKLHSQQTLLLIFLLYFQLLLIIGVFPDSKKLICFLQQYLVNDLQN